MAAIVEKSLTQLPAPLFPAFSAQPYWEATGNDIFRSHSTFSADNIKCCEPLTLISRSIAHQASGVGVTPTLSFSFNQPVKLFPGVIQVKATSDGTVIDSFSPGDEVISQNGLTLSLEVTGLTAGTEYEVIVPFGSIQSIDSNPFDGFSAGEYTFTA